MRNWVILLAIQFTLGAGFGFMWARWLATRRRRREADLRARTVSLLLSLEIKTNLYLPRGTLWTHPDTINPLIRELTDRVD